MQFPHSLKCSRQANSERYICGMDRVQKSVPKSHVITYKLGKMADEETQEEISEIQDNLQISRGEKEEVVVDLSQVDDIVVFDGEGNGYKFGDLYKDHKTIVIFVRVSNLLEHV